MPRTWCSERDSSGELGGISGELARGLRGARAPSAPNPRQAAAASCGCPGAPAARPRPSLCKCPPKPTPGSPGFRHPPDGKIFETSPASALSPRLKHEIGWTLALEIRPTALLICALFTARRRPVGKRRGQDAVAVTWCARRRGRRAPGHREPHDTPVPLVPTARSSAHGVNQPLPCPSCRSWRLQPL